MIDQLLIERCIREEPRAQYRLYKSLYGMMMSVCSRYERNRQDAVSKMNTGFLKILEGLEKRNKDVPFEFWARRIVINTAIDDFRKNKTRNGHEVLKDELDESSISTVNEYVDEMNVEELEALLLKLPEMTGRVFNLFAIDGFAHAEIAAMLDMSEGTSRWHVSNARTILQKAIGELSQKTQMQLK